MPLGDAVGLGNERVQALLGARKSTHIEPVLVQRLFQGIHLRTCNLGFGFADGIEIAGGDQTGEQTDDDDYDQQLKKSKAGKTAWTEFACWWWLAGWFLNLRHIGD